MAFTGIDDNTREFGDIASTELITAITNNLNYLIDSVPIGSIVPILSDLSFVPTPDPEIWQLCNGSLITNSKSPLRGSNTPDLETDGRMLKGVATVDGAMGGSRFKNLSHNHGGSTGAAIWAPDTAEDEEDDDQRHPFDASHTHTISSDLSPSVNFDPVHIKIKHYIKIN